jgi:hypothetical protein
MVTVITKTIGPNPPAPAPPTYDYGSFTAAEADVENIATLAFGSTDLVANDGAIVFEAAADTYNEAVTFQSTLTTDATRQVTYRAAAGSEHGGNIASGVRVTNSGIPLNLFDYHTRVEQLVAVSTGPYAIAVRNGSSVDACIAQSSYRPFLLGQAATLDVQVVTNCVAVGGSSSYWCLNNGVIVIANCTALSGGSFPFLIDNAAGALDVTLTNNIALDCTGAYGEAGAGSKVVTGSNNFGSSTSPFPVALQGSPATITASTAYDPGAGDFALYVGKNGALLDSPVREQRCADDGHPGQRAVGRYGEPWGVRGASGDDGADPDDWTCGAGLCELHARGGGCH